jgi:hypothetical protein
MNKPFAVIFIAAGASVLSGCPAGKGGVDYSPSQPRVVEPPREVNIEGTQTPLGVGAGAAVGGLVQADAATETLAEVSHLEALAAALEQHGWRVGRNADGDLLLFPPGDQSVTAPTRQPATVAATQAGTGDVTVTPGDLDRLGRELTKRGWRTEHNADGDLLLFPPSDKSVTEPTRKPATVPASQAGTGDVTVPSGDLDRLGRELTKRGWRVARDADGHLLVFPIGDAP